MRGNQGSELVVDRERDLRRNECLWVVESLVPGLRSPAHRYTVAVVVHRVKVSVWRMREKQGTTSGETKQHRTRHQRLRISFPLLLLQSGRTGFPAKSLQTLLRIHIPLHLFGPVDSAAHSRLNLESFDFAAGASAVPPHWGDELLRTPHPEDKPCF